jgi:hypothetical protein
MRRRSKSPNRSEFLGDDRTPIEVALLSFEVRCATKCVPHPLELADEAKLAGMIIGEGEITTAYIPRRLPMSGEAQQLNSFFALERAIGLAFRPSFAEVRYYNSISLLASAQLFVQIRWPSDRRALCASSCMCRHS